jgi:Fe-S cluster biogenesis protein NfuA
MAPASIESSQDYMNFKGDRLKMQDKVQVVLDKVRPALQRDGGNVELVSVSDGTVKVKLTGACAGCPMSTMTLKNGIERILKQEVPEVKQVVAV